MISLANITRMILDNSLRKVYYLLRLKFFKTIPAEEFDNQHPCVFILSTGRVGSETMAHLLGLEKNIFAYHEPHPRLYTLSKLAYEMRSKYLTDKNIKKTLKEAFLTSRQELLNYSLYCNHGYAETSPQVTFLAPLILDSIPNVKFIHLVRDPRKVVRSGMRRKWYDGHSHDSFRITPLTGTHFAKGWNNLTPFQKNLWLWAETNRWILEFTKHLSESNYLRVHSEDIFNKDIAEIAHIFNFIGVAIPSERKISSVLNKKLNMQRSGEFTNPDKWLETLDDNLKNFVQSISEELGYEFDEMRQDT